MASCLPPLSQEPDAVQCTLVKDYLDPWVDVSHLVIGGQSYFVEGAFANQPGRASRVGSMWIRGSADCWMPGEALKFNGDCRPWRILKIEGDWARLIFDSRSNPQFKNVALSKLNFEQRYWIEWTVFSMSGLAKAVRHTEFAPGDLYLDLRGGGSAVRPLSGSEKWRLSGLSEGKRRWLLEEGHSKQLGPLAGNSIPARMAEAVIEDESWRVSRYRKIVDKRDAGSFVLMEPSVGLYSETVFATFLIFVSLPSAEVLVWNGSELLGMVHALSQQIAFDMGCRWAKQLGAQEVGHCILLERPLGNSRARAVVHYDQQMPSCDGATRVAVSSVMHLPIGELAVAAMLQVQRMVAGVDVGDQPVGPWVSGRVAGTAAYQPELDETASDVDEEAFQLLQQKHESSISTMSALLQNDGSDDMLDWEKRLAPTDLSDYPSSQREGQAELEWSGLVVPDPHTPVDTKWSPLPEKDELLRRHAPQGWLSAVRRDYRPAACDRVKAFQKKLTA